MNYWNEGSSIEEKCIVANNKLKDVLQYQKEEQTFCREVQRIFDLIFVGNSASIYTSKPTEQLSIINFLSPDGLLFQAITRFMTYDYFRFNFALAWAPLTTQAIISDKSTRKLPEFFASKIRRTETIEMNIFELFFSYFAYGCAAWNSNNKKTLVCYKELLRRYMRHFFSTQLTASQNSNKISPGHVFLQIITQFWFNQNSMELYSKRIYCPPNLAVVEAIHEITEFFLGGNPLFNVKHNWEKEKVQIMTTIQEVIYPFLFEFLKVNFTAAADSQVSQNVLLFFEQVEIWLLVLRPWKFVDDISKKIAQSLLPEIPIEHNFLKLNMNLSSFFPSNSGAVSKPVLATIAKSSQKSDILDNQISHEYEMNIVKPYVSSSIVFYVPLLEIFLKRYSSIMLNNLDDENKKLYKVCEAFLDLKEYVKGADELITKINALPSYDRPTQGEGAVISKSLGLLGSSYHTLENITQFGIARAVVVTVQKKAREAKGDTEPLLKLLSSLFEIPVETLASTSPDKTQPSYPQLQRNEYEDNTGKLTSHGKDMLKRGQFHCTKRVTYTGDSRFQPTRSFEIDWLVKFTSDLSRRIEYTYGSVYDFRRLASQNTVILIAFILSFILYFIFGRFLFFLGPILLFLYFFSRR